MASNLWLVHTLTSQRLEASTGLNSASDDSQSCLGARFSKKAAISATVTS